MQNFASVNSIGTYRVDICSLECKLFETCLKFRIAIAPGGTSLLHWVSGWPPSTIVLCISYCLYCLGCLSQSCHLLKTGVPKFNPLILQEIQKSANIATKPNGLVVHASTGIEKCRKKFAEYVNKELECTMRGRVGEGNELETSIENLS